jgi:hypothetical protein
MTCIKFHLVKFLECTGYGKRYFEERSWGGGY